MMLTRRRSLQLLMGALGVPVLSSSARAQAYPVRPIRLVIPFPPGGAYDAVGRPWADKMKSLLGTVVVENKGGGGGSLGAASVAHAAPDGYTLLLGGTLPHVNEALLKSRPLYDPAKDLDPIAAIAANCLCVAVHPSLPATTLQELIAYAKVNPGKLSYGHAGTGSIQHLTGELFKSLAGTLDIVQVPYRGTGPLITDLIGDGNAGRDRPVAPTSPHRKSARACDHEPDAARRRARPSDRCGSGLSRHDGHGLHRSLGARRHSFRDRRSDRTGNAHSRCR
jgi:tripartite-type tricarboxylate transporter receptor subunit TctC